MIYAMILETANQEGDVYTLLITLFVFASCMCGPILRATQQRRQRRANIAAQQMRARQGERIEGGAFPTPPESYPGRDKNLQMWEETLLTTKEHGQKLEAIARLGRLGTKDTLDLLSEYAENDRDPEILAAIEKALEIIERHQMERRIRGEIEENPEA